MSPFRLLLCAAALWPSIVMAQAKEGAASREAYARLPVCRLGADGRSLEIEPCRTAPAQQPMPRRPVPSQQYPEPRIGIPDTSPAPASPETVAPRPQYPTAPVRPVPPAVNPSPYTPPAAGTYATPTPTRPSPATCVGSACTDAGGMPFTNNGTGVTRSPTGRHCTTSGGFVRCL